MTLPTLPTASTTPRPSPPTPTALRSDTERSPCARTLLPHFSSSNGPSSLFPPTHTAGKALQPEDFAKTPLEKSIEELQHTRSRVVVSFARMNQTQQLFEQELAATARVVANLEDEQHHVASVYEGILEFSAIQIQRFFREFLGRRLFRQVAAVKAALRIQSLFRACLRRREEKRKHLRLLCRKILRGLRGVRDRQEIPHAELLTRVGHNMQVETQWRKAMGVGDTENDLISALYRKKFVRQQLGGLLRTFYRLHSITRYWQSLLPQQPQQPQQPQPVEPLESLTNAEAESHEGGEQVECASADEGAELLGNGEAKAEATNRKIVIMAPRPSAGSGPKKALTREDLRRRQQKDNELRKGEGAKQQPKLVVASPRSETQRKVARKDKQQKSRNPKVHS